MHKAEQTEKADLVDGGSGEARAHLAAELRAEVADAALLVAELISGPHLGVPAPHRRDRFGLGLGLGLRPRLLLLFSIEMELRLRLL